MDIANKIKVMFISQHSKLFPQILTIKNVILPLTQLKKLISLQFLQFCKNISHC